MKNDECLQALEGWLNTPGNSHLKLAFLLGYKSPVTIMHWIKNRRIPHHMKDQVMNAIRKDLE